MSVEREDIYKAVWWLEHQRIFFFGAFILGGLLILALKSVGVHGAWITASAILIMLSYAVLAVKRRIKVRLDVMGDNLYYLGFLYTLISLSFSLYELGKGTADINALLQNFGLAIMTTLTGLALRVFFNQPKADLTEYENAVRMSLTEATANFIGETSKIGRDISTLRSVLNQIVQETVDSHKLTTTNLNNAVNQQIALLDQSSTINQKNIDELLRKISDTQKAFAASFETNSRSLSTSLSDSMSRIQDGSNGFVARFNEMADALGKLSTVMASLHGEIGNWSNTVGRIVTTSEATATNLERSTTILSQLQSNISNASGSVTQAVSEGTRAISSSTSSFTGSMAENISLIQTKFTELAKASTDATEIISRTTARLSEVSDVPNQTLKDGANQANR
jgi:hypothetical protein